MDRPRNLKHKIRVMFLFLCFCVMDAVVCMMFTPNPSHPEVLSLSRRAALLSSSSSSSWSSGSSSRSSGSSSSSRSSGSGSSRPRQGLVGAGKFYRRSLSQKGGKVRHIMLLPRCGCSARYELEMSCGLHQPPAASSSLQQSREQATAASLILDPETKPHCNK